MPEQFGSFTASELYCPKCRVAQPVRERLLLILPSGELHEYLCRKCGTSLGERKISAGEGAAQLRPAQTRRLLR
jgi:hypothetical protein